MPKKGNIFIANPALLLLLKVILLFPGIVLVIFVQVFSVKLPNDIGYICDVPFKDLITPLKTWDTLDFTQKDNVIKLDAEV